MAIAQCLLLPGGEINVALIQPLIESEAFKLMPIRPSEKERILHALKLVASQPEFSSRLAQATVPSLGTPGDKIVRRCSV